MKATFADGTLFEGTTEEFLAIRGHATSQQNGHKPAIKTGNGNPPMWDGNSARRFWDSLDPRHKGGKQKKILEFMIKNAGRATPDELKDLLGIEGEPGQKLAGVLANITRNARRETGNKKALVVDWISDGKGGCYYIPDGILQFFREM